MTSRTAASIRPRRVAAAIAAGLLVLTAAACGGDDNGTEPAATSSSVSTTTLAATGPATAAPATTGPTTSYPVTIENAYGTVTIPAAPEVVVSAGRTDHDVLLALGIQPAAVYQFLPMMSRGVGAWAEPLLEGTPTLLTNPLNYEPIAALQPDVITDVMTIGDEAQYDALATIAPTVGLPPDTAANSVPWQELTTRIASAVGKAADGERLVAETEAFLDETSAAHPEFAGKTVTVLLTSPDGIGVYSAADSRMQLLTALGFVASPHVESIGSDSFFQPLSPELVEEAESDVVVLLDRWARRSPTSSPPIRRSRRCPPTRRAGCTRWRTST
jgi:ABC-type Fe3+-hydroxamate transport system substrate-binding protein